MISTRSEFADDVCPVRDELLGELCRANDLFVPGFVSTLAPDVRASLALFCYRRAHLHSMGLAIAASCDEDDLVRVGATYTDLAETVLRLSAPSIGDEGTFIADLQARAARPEPARPQAVVLPLFPEGEG